MTRLMVVLSIAVSVHASSVPAQTGNPLVGTWSLVSTIMTLPDGTTRVDPQVGLTPRGYMIYGDANRMCAQFTNPARTAWKSTTQPTYDELKSMIDFMGAYCGRYEVNVSERYVLHMWRSIGCRTSALRSDAGISDSTVPIVSCSTPFPHPRARPR